MGHFHETTERPENSAKETTIMVAEKIKEPNRDILSDSLKLKSGVLRYISENVKAERPEIPENFLSSPVEIRHCPTENGLWDGKRGDSKWLPNGDFIPGKSNPERKTWDDILGRYNINGVWFNEGNPDFSDISKGSVEVIPFTDDRQKNFTKADRALAENRGCRPEEVRQWRKENGYTWHECENMKTMQKVPGEVHNNIPHSGGISNMKAKMGGD